MSSRAEPRLVALKAGRGHLRCVIRFAYLRHMPQLLRMCTPYIIARDTREKAKRRHTSCVSHYPNAVYVLPAHDPRY